MKTKKRLPDLVRTFERKLQRVQNINQPKLDNMLNRLLTHGMKKEPKPILVLYFTSTTLKEISKNGSQFLHRIADNVKGRYFILTLPVIDASQVRVELWHKGKKQSHNGIEVYENNIWAFHDLLKIGN